MDAAFLELRCELVDPLLHGRPPELLMHVERGRQRPLVFEGLEAAGSC
jgi:hypothetical protein